MQLTSKKLWCPARECISTMEVSSATEGIDYSNITEQCGMPEFTITRDFPKLQITKKGKTS